MSPLILVFKYLPTQVLAKSTTNGTRRRPIQLLTDVRQRHFVQTRSRRMLNWWADYDKVLRDIIRIPSHSRSYTAYGRCSNVRMMTQRSQQVRNTLRSCIATYLPLDAIK